MTAPTSKHHTLLFVDDEPNLLEGLRNQFRKGYVVSTACGAARGLELFREHGPFSIVVSDMRMPEMDGVQFLSIVAREYPSTVRVMLTGNADLETAMKAVNQGQIFRFVCKPCPRDIMAGVIAAAGEQYDLLMAEKVLLEKTLKGCVKVLIDILALANPAAFGRAQRVKTYTAQIARLMQVNDVWKIEVAALLSQIGCITLPPETMEKVMANQALTTAESAMFAAHSNIGRNLIATIPRLEDVAEMIGRQHNLHCRVRSNSHIPPNIVLGGEILKAVTDFDRCLVDTRCKQKAIQSMERHARDYNPDVLQQLHSLEIPEDGMATRTVAIRDIQTGMILAEDIRTKDGLLLLPKGQAFDDATKRRLENFHSGGRIQNDVHIHV